RAEQLKIEHGSALLQPDAKGRAIQLTSDHGLPERSVNLEHLQRIMSLRLEEIFQLIAQEIQSYALLHQIRSGVFLSGGATRIPSVQKLAEQVFEMPAVVGKTNCLSGLRSALDQPEFATSIGLVKFGSFEQQKRNASRSSLANGIKSTINQLFRRV